MLKRQEYKNKAQNTKQCKQLLDICQNNYLEQVVTKPTHITALLYYKEIFFFSWWFDYFSGF
jgi:hypothetical protein